MSVTPSRQGSVALRPGLHANVFRSPASTPSASSSIHTDNTSISIHGKRKRLYASSGTPTRETTPIHDWAFCEAKTTQPEKRQNVYTLAGQIETPGGRELAQDPMDLDDSIHSDVDYRRNMGPTLEQELGNTMPRIEDTAAYRLMYNIYKVDREGVQSILPRMSGNGWKAFAVNSTVACIGSVCDYVWKSFKGTAFSGFQAGGGQQYHSNPDGTYTSTGPPILSTTMVSRGYTANDTHNHEGDYLLDQRLQDQHPLAIEQPQATDFMSDESEPTTPTQPALKKRQTSSNFDGDEGLRNWVVVKERSPVKANTKKPYSTMSFSRPSSRMSTTSQFEQSGRDSVAPPRYASSTASSGRRISMPVSRLSTHSVVSTATSPSMTRRPSSRTSHAGSATVAGSSTLTAREPASFAMARSPLSEAYFPDSPSRIPVATSRLSANVFARNPPSEAEEYRQRSPMTPLRPNTSLGTYESPAEASPSRGSAHRRAQSSATVNLTPRGGLRRKNSVPHVASIFNANGERMAAAGTNSPRLDAEAKKLAARRRAEERATEMRMDAFSQQLQDMIRQGKEALGTRVSVEVDGGRGRSRASTAATGGWVDEEEDDDD